jgi:hypothetical protein
MITNQPNSHPTRRHVEDQQLSAEICPTMIIPGLAKGEG